jgi:uncharacterized protein
MNRNFFNFKKFDDCFLITNDFGEYDFLNEREFNDLISNQIERDHETARRLKDKDFLYDDKLDFINEKSSKLLSRKGHLTHAPSLHIFVMTNGCNQRCVYCQANGTGTSKRIDLSKESAMKAVNIALQSPEKNLSFEFQGGEPLLNFPIIKFIVEYAEARKNEHDIQYSLVTNLTLLTDEIIDFIKDHHITVSTSIDGDQRLHDCNRPFINESGTYEKVIQSIKKLRDSDIDIGAIETTTRQSFGHENEIVETYCKLGFDNIFLRPLTDLGKAYRTWNNIGYTAEEFLEFYNKCFDKLLEINLAGTYIRENHASIFLRKILGGFINYMELRSPCGAAVGQIAYNADGRIFTCDEARMMHEMGDDSFCIGDVDHSSYISLIKNSISKTVCAAGILESIPGCSDCVYQPYCGVCPVVNYAAENDIISRKIKGFRCRIYMGILDRLFSELHNGDPDIIKILRSWGE